MYEDRGSLKKAVEGDYDFDIGSLLSAAWDATSGIKLTFAASLFVYIVIIVAVSVVFGAVFNLSEYPADAFNLQALLAQVAVELLTLPIEIPMLTALLMMGIKHVNYQPVRVTQLFDYYVMVWPLVFASILMYLLLAVGFMLLILPGIYLSIAYIFVYPLMIDKNLGIWEAMETSRKAVTHRWFGIFFLMLAMAFISVISAIPLGIGLFWTVPMSYLLYGMLYTRIFGYEGDEQHLEPESDTDFGEMDRFDQD